VISKNRLAVAAIGAGLVTSLLGMGAAQADPTGAPTPRALNGVGSDTTQDVMNQIAQDVQIGGVKQIGSFNATGSATIAPTSTCSLARPNGSGAGRTALLNSLSANGGAGDGCVQFARSSSLNVAASSPSLTYVPFAVDAVSFAVTSDSSVGRSFSLTELQAIYHCDPSVVGTGPNYSVTPILPQAGSGTRSYWETQMGITDADVNNHVYPCILNGSRNGVTIEEHTGTSLDSKSIEPFSIGQYNSQASGLIPDRRGKAVLGVIDGTEPTLTNGSFAVKRDVYNVIPTSQIGNAPYSTVFVGAGSLICADTATIQQYGFALNPNCGSTSNHS
jgi:ABC-type phosphate transport system substrate-binding protein